MFNTFPKFLSSQFNGDQTCSSEIHEPPVHMGVGVCGCVFVGVGTCREGVVNRRTENCVGLGTKLV